MRKAMLVALILLGGCDEPIADFVARCRAAYNLNDAQCVSAYRSGGDVPNPGFYSIVIW